MERIESTRNELVKMLRSLEGAKGRRESGLFLIEGEKLCRDALEAGCEITHCLLEDERLAPLAQQAQARGAKTYAIGDAVLSAISTTKGPQGILFAARIPERAADAAGAAAPLLILDGVQDPGNVGTMLRTAEAAGFGGALLGAGCADPCSPKVVRGSSGSVFRIPLFFAENLAAELAALREAGWCVAATAMEGEDFFLRAAMPRRRALVIGSEGKGISQEALAQCDRRLTLPMAGGAQSLNAAVAAGIMMFDWFRECRG